MNVLGHPYIAWRVFKDFNVNHLVGSWLPDLVPFVPDSVFAFEEIHEGGETLLKFLRSHYPDKSDLALGMLAHSYTYGADKFSPVIEKQFEDKRSEVTEKIVQASPNLAGNELALRGRFHNFLWWGVDVQILRNEDEFMKQLLTLIPQINLPETSKLLSECFDKPEREVERMVRFLLASLSEENVSSVKGLAVTWQSVAAGLPERDQVDVEKCVEAFNFCADLVEPEWHQIVDNVTRHVRTNIESFMKP